MASFLGEMRFAIKAETPLVFIHLPKCAGTSVHDYLCSVFPKEAIFPGRHISDFDKIVEGYSVYSGHMLLRQWKHAAVKPHFVTWVRHPVARTISAFYFFHSLTSEYVLNSQDPQWLQNVRERSFFEFITSNDEGTRFVVGNGMSRMLCPVARVENSWSWLLAWAGRAALKRFAYVGVAEQTEECLLHLARRFQLPAPSRVFRSNTYEENSKISGSDVARLHPATPEIIAAIEQRSAVDLGLYSRARYLSSLMR